MPLNVSIACRIRFMKFSFSYFKFLFFFSALLYLFIMCVFLYVYVILFTLVDCLQCDISMVLVDIESGNAFFPFPNRKSFLYRDEKRKKIG